MEDFIGEVIALYFKGYTVKQALKIMENRIKEEDLYIAIKNYEGRVKHAAKA
ncbi:hypothetical protein JMF89_00945 [Clostridiaceae bacterium UIB06]|nr:hypothetical protein [Clostridiaceae bacterium UIB06]